MIAAVLLALAGSSMIDVDANARAEGNRRAIAVRVGRALLRTQWPAQVLKIRVDGIEKHSVAGILISGVKFHRPLDPSAFTWEVVDLVQETFASSDVEEVDVWATVPLPKFKQKPVYGEFLQPTDRIVYGATILRSEAKSFAVRLQNGNDVYWEPRWKKSLSGH